MHRASLLQLSLWITNLYALVQGVPESQYEARSQDVDPTSKGFVTFKLVKKAALVSTLHNYELMSLG